MILSVPSGPSWFVFQKGKGQLLAAPFTVMKLLQTLNVGGLQALRAFFNGELHCLTFLQRTETVRLDGRKMDEYVFTALTADKAVTLCVIEPLHCSLFHGVAKSFSIGVASESEGTAGQELAGVQHCSQTVQTPTRAHYKAYC